MELQAVVRCDVLLLLALVGLFLLLDRQISIYSGAYTGLATATASAAVSIAVDSVFWRRLVWPELSVLLFNTVENKCASLWRPPRPDTYGEHTHCACACAELSAEVSMSPLL